MKTMINRASQYLYLGHRIKQNAKVFEAVLAGASQYLYLGHRIKPDEIVEMIMAGKRLNTYISVIE